MRLLMAKARLRRRFKCAMGRVRGSKVPVTQGVPVLTRSGSPCKVSMAVTRTVAKFTSCFEGKQPSLFLILKSQARVLNVYTTTLGRRVPVTRLRNNRLARNTISSYVQRTIAGVDCLRFPTARICHEQVVRVNRTPRHMCGMKTLNIRGVLDIPVLSRRRVQGSIRVPTNVPCTIIAFRPIAVRPNRTRRRIQRLVTTVERRGRCFCLIAGTGTSTKKERMGT